MEALKKRRAVLRTAFTRVANQLDLVLNAEEDVVEADAVHEVLQHKIHALKAADDDVFNLLMSENASEEDLTAEINICDEYAVKYTRLRVRYQKWKSEKSEVVSGNAASSESNQSGSNTRKFSLPKIEIIKFGGELREWLPFWSQFKKIHVATDIDLEDKFQYLLQAITPGTRARELVGSYPPTAENYQKAIDSLKSRFGRDDLLVEVYVRELLKLVLNNAMSNNSRCSIATLYDQIETQLRSLETLGVNTDTCSAMLYPLVESCLPEELLRVWQRSTEFSDKPEGTLKNRLERLLRFLKKEVEDAERISLAIEGFNIDLSDNKQRRNKPKMVGQSLPTAAGLLNNNVSMKCVFCDGDHDTEKCFKAQKLSVEEKKSILTKKKACFRCARIGHSSRKCRERLRCLVCGSQHIVLLCPELANKTNGERGKRVNSEKPIENQESKTETGLANRTDTKVFLQTLVVKIRSEDGEREARAIIDTGSQRSYVLKRVAQELHYQPKRTETIVHALFGGAQTSEQQHTCYDVRLVSLDGEFACRFEALDQPVICNDIPSVFSGVWSEELRKAGVRLTDTKGRRPIDLLIGADIAGKIFTGKRKVLQCGLIAIETLLGWVLMGKVPGSTTSPSTTMMVTSLLSKDAQISELWQLDVLGITDPSEKRSKAEIALATKELFNATISRDDDGRYEVKLPWREGHPPLSSNYEMAKKRLTSIEKRLRNNGYYERYREVFNEWLEENIIEEVPKEELKNPAHYLPHRPVIKEDSATTKIRPVFDASAKEKGEPSLNDCTEKGANLIELIPSILLRFREQRIGVTSDIRKAFLQISLSRNDRDFVRFLWKAEDGTEIIYRHRRVVFGINASPFLLGATIEFHLRNVLDSCETDGIELTIRKLLNGFYVDNCVTSVPNETALINFRSEATELMAMAKFDLRGWEFTGNQDSEIDTIPLLGLKWNTKSDVLTIGYDSESPIEDRITKRVILSTAQRIFDPVGFSCPATLFPKLLLQKMWEENIGWDEEVTEEKKYDFQRWVSELPYLARIEIPRWIEAEKEEYKRFSLHTFCDASGLAYAAAVFLRVEKQGRVKVYLLQAKSRVAPIKKLSVPRLELLAASIGARLYSQVREALEMEVDNYFWSDSTTALCWIRREDTWATFVWNRVQEIRSLTSVDSWRYVPGAQNPADLPSRGCSPKQLANSCWWEGPQWLYETQTRWPHSETLSNEGEVNKERKKNLVTTMLTVETNCFYNYFSKYDQIIRMIAWIRRFSRNCKNRNDRKTGELSVEEVDTAETKLLKIIQEESFTDKESKQFASLNVFTNEDGLIRLRTRISRREDLQNFLFPVVLPGKHPVVRRLIHDTHVKACHVGVQGLLSLLRERFWILGGRRSIRSIVNKCKVCTRYHAKNMEMRTPELPKDRVRDAVTFEITGVDLAGPLYLRDGNKVWISLFTCAVYRAVHLDIVSTLTTNDFIKVLRRFIARRGRPRIMYTDNGTNFRGTENIFGQIKWDEIQRFSTAQRVIWRFSPPSAPWWGGWWERLIGILKQLLRKVLGRACLSNEELYTVLCDCESVINSRPLTYVSNEPTDLVPLTPAMFLRELTETGVPDCDAADAIAMNKRYRYLQKVRSDLRNRFRIEYLGQMTRFSNKQKTNTVSVGDVVIVGNDTSKRLDWPLGRVTELLPGKDKQVRLVRVQTAHGSLLRPIQRLYPLECIGTSDGSSEEGTSTEAVSTDEGLMMSEDRCTI